MNQTEIYESSDYKQFLTSRLKQEGRGANKKLAEHLRCDPSFLSQVLNGKQNLSPEQGLVACDFLHLNKYETRYFLKMLDLARAGTESLNDFYQEQLLEMKQDILSSLKKTGDFVEPDLPLEFYRFFFSGWHPSAIHAALAIPGLQTSEALSSRLQISPTRVEDVLNEFRKFKVVEKKEDQYILTSTQFTSFQDPVFNDLKQLFHLAWKTKLRERYQNERSSDDLNANYVAAMSESNYKKLRSMIHTLLTSSSPEGKQDFETIVVLGLDLVKM